MSRRLTATAALALAVPFVVGTAGSAWAAQPADPGKGGRCVAAGTSVLASLGATSAAAQGTLDYGPFVGPSGIRLDSGPTTGVFLPFKDVIALHRTSPSLFAWCDNV